MERNNERKYVLLYFGAIITFSVSGALVHYSQLGVCNTAFYRMLFCLPLFYPLARRELPKMERRDLFLLLGGGLLLGINLALWNYSLVSTTQANANLLANLHIFATVPLSCLFYQEKISRGFLLGVCIALTGMVVLLLGKADPQAGYFIGDAAAFLSCLFYGGYIMVTYATRDRLSAGTTIFMTAIGCLVILLPIMALTEGIEFPRTWRQLWPILAITGVGQCLGIGLVSLCLGRIKASLASTLSLTQPVFGAILGLALFGEHLSLMEIGGIAVISAGVGVAQQAVNRQSRRSRQIAAADAAAATERA